MWQAAIAALQTVPTSSAVSCHEAKHASWFMARVNHWAWQTHSWSRVKCTLVSSFEVKWDFKFLPIHKYVVFFKSFHSMPIIYVTGWHFKIMQILAVPEKKLWDTRYVGIKGGCLLNVDPRLYVSRGLNTFPNTLHTSHLNTSMRPCTWYHGRHVFNRSVAL